MKLSVKLDYCTLEENKTYYGRISAVYFVNNEKQIALEIQLDKSVYFKTYLSSVVTMNHPFYIFLKENNYSNSAIIDFDYDELVGIEITFEIANKLSNGRIYQNLKEMHLNELAA